MSGAPQARSAQREAQAILPEGYVARVLEPSPPAVDDGDTYADDPAAVGDADGADIVTPTSAGEVTWDELARDDARIGAFARANWLGNWKRLGQPPPDYPSKRDDAHRLAYAVVAIARRQANGRFGLRWTRGGFGTPFFGDDAQVRIEGAQLVVQHGERVDASPITTLAAAGSLAGVEPSGDLREGDTVELGDPERELAVDDALMVFLDDWFGFSWSVIEEVRVTPGAADVGRTQLWPGHFDPAFEMGAHGEGVRTTRATYGCSPGDADHDEPYLYVAAWGDIDRTERYWNDTSFNGASLPYAQLVAAADQRAEAIDFFRRGHEILTA